MTNPNIDQLKEIHRYLIKNGFEAQYAGSMIQYRQKKNPTVSLALIIKEHPYRKAKSHGLLEYSLKNSTFLAGPELEEQAQEVINGLVSDPILPRASIHCLDFEGILDKKSLTIFKTACDKNQNLREGFKIFLKAVFDWFNQETKSKKTK
ncbi:MAG TPA: hypothetical protein VI874_02320 [Candidatus Norongarragalinales archaeon]|nr:hypothetical protein [Candidatus Norongarragalinales archaeon]